jgi:hypothetical protein
MPYSPLKTGDATIDRNLQLLQQVIADIEATFTGAERRKVATLSIAADIPPAATFVRYVGKAGATLRLPSAKAQGAGIGQRITIQNAGGAVTIAPIGQDTLNGSRAGLVVSASSQLTVSSDADGAWTAETPADNAITDGKLRDSAGTSVIGRAAGTAGDPGDIVAGADGAVLRRASGALGFGSIPESSVDGLASDVGTLTDLERRFRLLLRAYVLLLADLPPGLENEFTISMGVGP